MERWNNCTHTFIFGFGEMTLTPINYTAITGLGFDGPAAPLDAQYQTAALGAQLIRTLLGVTTQTRCGPTSIVFIQVVLGVMPQLTPGGFLGIWRTAIIPSPVPRIPTARASSDSLGGGCLIPPVPARLIPTYGPAHFRSRSRGHFDFGDKPVIRWTCPSWRIRLVTAGSMNLNYVLYASLDRSVAYFPDRISRQYGMIQRVPRIQDFESGPMTHSLLTNLADRWRNRNTWYLG
ncbi:hypothetical protein JCGZ_05099 [Jatropha curcas]|uniref:Aminotransferase-like plant mobile domain-containing protein n=1 Tax=Jatropha curcas TaxID=180498 RepID=A0A067LFA3_JATCU|nr:hypothetical protein JCGZ_05099 [Jatropha curcas]